LRSSPASDFKANFALSGSRVGSGGAVKRVGARTAEVSGSNPRSLSALAEGRNPRASGLVVVGRVSPEAQFSLLKPAE
jgi:hypothetical protein